LLRYAHHARPRTDPAALHTPPYWEFALLSGVLATIIGVLLVSPLAIRLLAAAGNRAPLAVRLALRDLGRYRSRSASALAAVTLGLAAAVFFVVTAAAAAADEDNLSERHVMVWLEGAPDLVPDLAPDRFAAATAAVDRLAAALGGAAVVPLEVAVTPDAGATADPAEDGDRLPPVRAAWRAADDDRPRSEPLYVATPALLAHYGAEGTARRGGADVLTVHSGRITLLTPAGPDHPESHPSTARLDVPPYASLPRTLITKEALDRRGWTARPAGWLVETAAPVSKGQLAAIRNLAAGAGLTVEVRRDRPDLTVTAWALTGAATVLALGILAMTVAILRSEAGRDLRVLVATGAGVRMQRAVTATVAGSLALAGALLGAGCAYLVAGPANPGGDLTQVPVAHLTTVILGVPALAAAAGWLLSGREPPALARPALE
jgi:putative ABC transport system permease protein